MNTAPLQVRRMRPVCDETNPLEGEIIWSPVKSLWFTTHLVIAVVGGWLTISTGAVLLSGGFTVITLCLGHTVGLHRLLIHRSFNCPRWLEHALVHLGTVVGMGGPFAMLYLHDIRDWAQRHPACHPFFIDQRPIWRDALWQLHCRLNLKHPPQFEIEREVREDRFYQVLERTWMLQQLPYAVLFYLLGGIGWVVWGISVRIVVSLIGHWLIGYFAHNTGQRDWHLQGHAVQGYNIPHLGLITMGECWHNNHHAFPDSARLGLTQAQPDPGWWALRALNFFGLITQVKLPADMPERPELIPLKTPGL
ncbi:MAG: acyl-CoA desaturase [Prosthecobacter sp.]|uniref:acyl-CoA desaturase n=1 Tax=Prosthecobacter sp. TaxID=1965333 RepID=UPI00261BB009|nr:acyl-CoA desaturase [Prosthecobacter sp.]MCF7788984.1 acyl-CoA desaturase [Prosthecobacter sp.]